MGSTAYSEIVDPRDPAWIGHWHELESARRRSATRRAAAVLLLVAAVLVVAATAFDREPATEPSRPSAVPVAPVELPAITTTERASDPATPAAPATDDEPAIASGSGWAPADATVSPSERGSGLLRGDLSGLHPRFIAILDALAVDMGVPLEVISGWRNLHEQQELYDRYRAGTGNLAAVPGTSRHEVGLAADVYVDGVALADVPGAARLARRHGLAFPVAGEAWHVELLALQR